MKIVGLLKSAALILAKHKSAILAGTAIITGVGTTVLAVKATIESVKDIEELKDAKAVASEESEDPQETTVGKTKIVKTVWKHYIPVVLGTAVTVTCVICAHRVDAKRIAAATSALVLSEKMRKELEHRTIDELGHEKLKEIKKTIFKEQPELDNAYKNGQVDVLEPEWRNPKYVRKCWFRDEITGREFWSSKSEIEYGMMKAMREGLLGGAPYVSLNAFFSWLDLEPCVMGELLGWDISKQEINVSYEPDQTADGDPCLIMHYYDKPRVI